MRARFFALLAAALVGACASAPPLPPQPTPAEIVKMAKEGMAPEAIIQRIAASQGVYPLPASALAKLREQGVPDPVIDYMQRTYIDAVRFDEYLRARDDYLMFGWPYYRGVYPFPYGTLYPYYWGWR